MAEFSTTVFQQSQYYSCQLLVFVCLDRKNPLLISNSSYSQFSLWFILSCLIITDMTIDSLVYKSAAVLRFLTIFIYSPDTFHLYVACQKMICKVHFLVEILGCFFSFQSYRGLFQCPTSLIFSNKFLSLRSKCSCLSISCSITLPNSLFYCISLRRLHTFICAYSAPFAHAIFLVRGHVYVIT